MTRLTSATHIARETASVRCGRQIIVELHPGFLTLRLKGLRDEPLMLDYNTAYECATKIAAREQAGRK